MKKERSIRPTLRIVRGGTPGRLLEISRQTTSIGRGPDCDVVLDDKHVSTRHARIVQRGDGFVIEDLQSRNGTWVEDRKLTGPVLLRDGDTIQLCDNVLVFNSQVVQIQEEGENLTQVFGSRDAAAARDPRLLAVKPEEKLRAILEISRVVGSTLDLGEILERTLEALFRIFPQVDRGFVLLVAGPDGDLIPRAIKSRDGDPESPGISRTILHHVLNLGRAIYSKDAAVDGRFRQSPSVTDHAIRTLMCVPFLNREHRPIGVIQVDTRDRRSRFDQEDLDLLVAVASQVGIALENARLHQELIRQRELELELRYARQVQSALLPERRPEVAGYAFWDVYEPAHQVGGDYFGYLPVGRPGARPQAPGCNWAVALGDVAGKGMSAALLMAKLSAEVRLLLLTEADPSRAVERLNQHLCDTGIQDKFITFLLVLLDGAGHHLTVVNAGHMAPLFRRADGRVEVFGQESNGLALAIDRDRTYAAVRTTLGPGDLVVIYTDGVSDATDPQGRYFGLERLKRVLQDAPPSAAEAGAAILQAVNRYTAGRAPHDDLTLVCFGRVS